MIQYGASDLFNEEEQVNKDLDVSQIIAYSENKTHEVYGKLKSLEDKMNITNLSLLSNSNDIYKFEGEDYKNYNTGENNFLVNSNFGSRERKYLYINFLQNQNNEQQRKKPRVLTGWRAKVNGGYDHQLYNKEKLDKLDLKEKDWNDYLALFDKEKINDQTEILLKNIREPSEFTQEDEDIRNNLLNEGYPDWSKKDFARLCEALKTIRIEDYQALSLLVKGKSKENIEEYIKKLIPNLSKIKGGSKLQARIKNVQQEFEKIQGYHSKIKEIFEEITEKTNDVYDNIILNNKQAGKNKTITPEIKENPFELDDEKYLLCMLFKYGYGNWSQIKYHILFDPKLQFNLNLKTKTEDELKDICSKLLNSIKLNTNSKLKSKESKKNTPSKSKEKSNKKEKKDKQAMLSKKRKIK